MHCPDRATSQARDPVSTRSGSALRTDRWAAWASCRPPPPTPHTESEFTWTLIHYGDVPSVCVWGGSRDRSRNAKKRDQYENFCGAPTHRYADGARSNRAIGFVLGRKTDKDGGAQVHLVVLKELPSNPAAVGAEEKNLRRDG